MAALEGARAKLDRGEDVIEQLNTAIVAYMGESPYEIVGQFEPERSEYVFRGRVTQPVPLVIGVIVGEIIHDVRSALDHLVWQLALLNTATPTRVTQFPIAISEEEFRSNRGQNMIRDLAPKHRTAIEELQPYKGTDTGLALYDLRVLSNTDKHRVINASIARSARHEPIQAELSIVRDATAIRDVVMFPGGPVDGAELARMTLEGVGPDPKVKMEGQLPVIVTFDDPALTVEHPTVVAMVRTILRMVREVILGFEGDLP